MKIGIIGAMDVEVARLTAAMTKEREMERAGMHFCEGRIGGTEAVVVRCGIGKVNAGLCVQILCDLFGVTHVINTGIAGSLDEEINIGDIVVSIDAMYHDMDVTGLGYEPGQVPQLKVLAFPADKMLREAAVKACQEAAPEIGVFEGRVVSGDQFICERGRKGGRALRFDRRAHGEVPVNDTLPAGQRRNGVFYDIQAKNYHCFFNRACTSGTAVHAVLHRDRKRHGEGRG